MVVEDYTLDGTLVDVQTMMFPVPVGALHEPSESEESSVTATTGWRYGGAGCDTVLVDGVARAAGAHALGITSLADGADTLFARAVLDAGGRLQAVIPAANYNPPALRHLGDRTPCSRTRQRLGPA